MKYIAAPLLLVTAVLAQNGSSKSPNLDIPAISRKANGSIVSIVMSDKDGNPIALGSGFFVSKDGLVMTNYHVIKSGTSAVIKLPNGAFFVVDGVFASDKERDVAVIKAHGNNFRPLTLGDSSRLQVGEEVVAIGSPLSLEATVSNGIVSGVRNIEKEGGKLLQITAPISPGSSGGPLFNMAGEVVGITTSRLIGGENLNFAIPINDVKYLPAEISKVRPLPNEVEPIADSPAPETVGQLTYEETKTGYVFKADCSAINVEGCAIFNEIAKHQDSFLFQSLQFNDKSIVCFYTDDWAKNFTIWELHTYLDLPSPPQSFPSFSVAYINGILAEGRQRIFYLVPSAFDSSSFDVKEPGIPNDEQLRGELSQEAFSYHRKVQDGKFENWDYDAIDVSLLTGRMTTHRGHAKPIYGRCFSWSRPHGKAEGTENEVRTKRRELAALINTEVEARKQAERERNGKDNDCVRQHYKQLCPSCTTEQVDHNLINAWVQRGPDFVATAERCNTPSQPASILLLEPLYGTGK
jgi:hypothetical protein